MNKKIRPYSLLSTAVLCFALTFGCNWFKSLFSDGDPSLKETAVIKTEYGNISIEFFPDTAPKHVESFKNLTKKGFYNGTTFHRVIPGFMIQGGDPMSRDQNKRELHGRGDPGYKIPAEFSNHKHVRGIVSAARSTDPNSAGSQFFIVAAATPHLDGKYSVFGRVISGMDTVDKIITVKRDGNDNPLKPVTMNITLLSPEEAKTEK